MQQISVQEAFQYRKRYGPVATDITKPYYARPFVNARSFNTASGMAQLQPTTWEDEGLVNAEFQYRKRYGPVATKDCTHS